MAVIAELVSDRACSESCSGRLCHKVSNQRFLRVLLAKSDVATGCNSSAMIYNVEEGFDHRPISKDKAMTYYKGQLAGFVLRARDKVKSKGMSGRTFIKSLLATTILLYLLPTSAIN